MNLIILPMQSILPNFAKKKKKFSPQIPAVDNAGEVSLSLKDPEQSHSHELRCREKLRYRIQWTEVQPCPCRR